ncbi:hypothetical protein C8Q74DRAFT_1212530 [Fomes fomentarius]|nr:hypothetical protein C8Q74DRAFT_1212530 [Fomes fomentarius]
MSSGASSHDSVDLIQEQITSLRKCISAGPPYCHGTVSTPISNLDLYFGKGESAQHLNFSNATPTQLQLLAEACQRATFGVNQQDVLDETYRKAGKLDNDEFMIRFDPTRSGILDIVHSELAIDRLIVEDAIRPELYKLNVYGPGSFFRPHVDTPRGELQFGSLVIVFPATHEGGALKIRYAENPNESAEDESEGTGECTEYTFDSSTLLSTCAEPSIAYVAFFSDVEHEVLPVISGYRVTITYNLYWATNSETSTTFIPRPISATAENLRATMRRLLDDRTFLPDGGHLMFGLAHKYPLAPTLEPESKARQALRDVGSRLKANDAAIYKVMQELSLPASFKILYTSKERYSSYVHVACDRVIPLDRRGGHVEKPVWKTMCKSYGGMLLSRPCFYYPSKYSPPIAPNVQWVTSAPRFALQTTTFMAYGNQAALDVIYWRIYLLVRVGPAGDRAGEPLVVDDKDSEDGGKGTARIILNKASLKEQEENEVSREDGHSDDEDSE